MFGREITKYTVIRCIYSGLANPTHTAYRDDCEASFEGRLSALRCRSNAAYIGLIRAVYIHHI